MAQTGYTPISIYYSATAAAAPTAGNLVAGELAINTNDGKLFYKDSGGVVQVIGTKGGVGSSTTTQVLYNNAGTVAGSVNFVFDGSSVGVGAIPSAFGTGFKAVQLNGGAIMAFGGATMYYLNNTYYDGTNYKYVNTGYALNYVQSAGTHFWSTAPSGTAGATVTFTQAMFLNNSGSLGIGTISPNILSSTKALTINSPSAANYSALELASAGTITAFLQANNAGAFLGTAAATPLSFYTNSAQRISIDSSGSLLINTANTNPILNRNNGSVFISSNGGLLLRSGVSASAFGLDATSGTHITFYTDNGTTYVAAGAITSSGSVTAFVTTSDYRLKENIVPLENALDKVSKLKPVTYTFKNSGQKSEGFIAHELQSVIPDCVFGEKDGMRIETYEISPAIPAEIDEDGKTIKEAVEAVMGEKEVPAYQGIDTSFLVATLTSAIQEQQAMINELKAKVAALEAT